MRRTAICSLPHVGSELRTARCRCGALPGAAATEAHRIELRDDGGMPRSKASNLRTGVVALQHGSDFNVPTQSVEDHRPEWWLWHPPTKVLCQHAAYAARGW